MGHISFQVFPDVTVNDWHPMMISILRSFLPEETASDSVSKQPLPKWNVCWKYPAVNQTLASNIYLYLSRSSHEINVKHLRYSFFPLENTPQQSLKYSSSYSEPQLFKARERFSDWPKAFLHSRLPTGLLISPSFSLVKWVVPELAILFFSNNATRDFN